MKRKQTIITSTEAAKILGMTRQMVGRHAIAGRLIGRKPGRDWVFYRADVEAFAKVPRRRGPKPS